MFSTAVGGDFDSCLTGGNDGMKYDYKIIEKFFKMFQTLQAQE